MRIKVVNIYVKIYLVNNSPRDEINKFESTSDVINNSITSNVEGKSKRNQWINKINGIVKSIIFF